MEVPDDLLNFFNNYPLDYWRVKLYWLSYQLENLETKSDELTENKDISNFKDKFEDLLHFEIHFMKFQIIEALFSLIFALEEKEDKFLWFNISFPETPSQRSFAVYDKISKFSHIYVMETFMETPYLENSQSIPFWQYLFFYKFELAKQGKDLQKISKNISTLLSQMASTFVDREAFNAYKHALRCYSTSNVSISARQEGTDAPFHQLSYAKNMFTYLTKETRNNNVIVNVKLKAFSPNEDIYYIEKAVQLMSNLINTRKAFFFNKEVETLFFFEKIDRPFHGDYTLLGWSRGILTSRYLFTVGHHADSLKNYEDAIQAYRKILQIDPMNYQAIFCLGNSYLFAGELDQAIVYFKQYLRNTQAEHRKQALFNLSVCFFEKGEYHKAKTNIREILKKYHADGDPLVIEARYLLANTLLKQNAEYFRKTGRNKSGYVNVIFRELTKIGFTNFKYPVIWFELAFILKILKRNTESRQIFEKLYEHDPRDIPTLLNLAELCIKEHTFEQAEDYLQKAIDIDKKYFNTWNLVCYLRHEQNDLDGMKEASNKAMELAKDPSEKKFALSNLGRFYIKKKDYTAAIKKFKEALKIDKEFDPARHGIIKAWFKSAEFDEIIHFTEDLELSRSNIDFMKMRAYAFSELENFQESFNLINVLLQLTQNNEIIADLFDTKGDIYRKKGDYKLAINCYEQSLKISKTEYLFTAETQLKIKDLQKKLGNMT